MSLSSLLAGLMSQWADISPVRRWNVAQGYREVLSLCLPLIASFTASSLMLFTDRLFLSHFSLNAIAASLPAGVAKVASGSIFMGIASYVGVFVAQYIGAGQPRRAAASLWQALYFSLFAGLLLSLLYFPSPWLFGLGTANSEIVALQIDYFGCLTLLSPVELAAVTMSCFMAAIGRTKVVMWVSLISAFCNIPLNYILIFGVNFGEVQLVPRLGVLGAALATASCWVISVIIYARLIFNSKMEAKYAVFSEHRFDWKLTKRLLKYGWPGGLQFFMELFAFGFFSFAVSRLDDLLLACNNIVFSIEALSFFPMIGVGQAVSIIVGQAIGRKKADEGARAVKTGTVISTIYVFSLAACFVIFPKELLSLFVSANYDVATADLILNLGSKLLFFVAIYSLMDGFYLCTFGAVKGAGDVWFPMAAMFIWGILGIVAPILALFWLGWADIFNMWLCMIFYIFGLTITGIWRYKSGKWMTMKVIEAIFIETPKTTFKKAKSLAG
ncbi:MAG: MATE family efflux transporter [Deltaproteobacteria bacterium]|jgi:MATE family multidrug resistance protein|nr:MATE family efflux transporter [Deltaproteobacteria bacterium]